MKRERVCIHVQLCAHLRWCSVALASLLERVDDKKWKGKEKVNVVAVDVGDWSQIIQTISSKLESTFPNLFNHFKLTSQTYDILSAPSATTPSYSTATFVTILFTISELFLQSRTETIKFLANLTQQCKPGCLLLIVESASLGMVKVGKSGAEYPLGMMLDHLMISDQDGVGWQVERKEESIWYRMPEGSGDCYPLPLENSRVMIRLYRKL